MDPKEARKKAGRSLAYVAGEARVGEVTARIYEVDPQAVSRASRAKLKPVYESLAAMPGEEDEQ